MSLGFLGAQYLSIDAKGRLTLPSRHRDALNNKVVVTVDLSNKCLILYPLDEWLSVSAKVRALPTMKPATRRFQRLFFGYAHDLDIDSSGRILLPAVLREYAQLDKKAALVGQGHKMELWSESAWAEELGEIDFDGLEEFPAELEDLVL